MLQKVMSMTGLILKTPGTTTVRQTVRLLSSSGVVRKADNSLNINESNSDTTGQSGLGTRPDQRSLTRRDYRFIFPEFLPDPNMKFRNTLREKLERKDMLARREKVEIPEFYVGSIMAVTVSDPASPHPNKQSRFVGLCIDRGGTGLRAWFILRNVLEGMGVEFMYQMYNPSVAKVEVLRLEKRLDEELYYLRDAPLQYSTFPQDMEIEILPEGSSVPVNNTVVKLNPRPWLRNWELLTEFFDGLQVDESHFITPGKIRRQERAYGEGSIHWNQQTLQFDLMRDYRNTVPMESQDQVWEEVGEKLEERDKQMRKVAAKRAFVRPVKRL